MNSMIAGFEKIGIKRRDATVGAAMISFLKSGGTIERLHELADQCAARMPGKGQIFAADKGQNVCARPRQPLEDVEGHPARAGEATIHLPSASSSPRERNGHTPDAEPATATLPAAREPTAQQRLISARNAKAVAITVMETYQIHHRTSDGKFMQSGIGDFTISMARSEGKRKTTEGYVLREAVRFAEYRIANLTGAETIREVFGTDYLTMQRIIQRGAEYADVV